MTDRQKAAAEDTINAYRAAAAIFPVLREVIERFDGKQLNKRLETALEEATGCKGCILARVKYDSWYVISFSPAGHDSHYNFIDLCYIKLEEATNDTKRINAAAIVDHMREKRAEILKKAYEIEETGRNVEKIRGDIATLKKALENILEGIPAEARDIFNIKVHSWYFA